MTRLWNAAFQKPLISLTFQGLMPESFVTQLFGNKIKTLSLPLVSKLTKIKTLLCGTDTIHNMLCRARF